MSAEATTYVPDAPPMDLSKWRNLPLILIVSGLVLAGLAGIGDLVVSCCSSKTRNRHAGELIAQGLTPERAVAEIGQTVEGLTTAPVLRDLSHRLGVELPITEGVCSATDRRRSNSSSTVAA